ncbi:MAG: GNAT family N-acetyltransferase [Oxalobacter sp.]|nr:GNAT family N-acetyltransferase [Oxalobacter sp.]
MGVTVSEASEEDAPLIAELTRKAWENRCPPTSHGHTDTADSVITDLHEGGAFILWVDDKPAGSVRWAPTDEDDEIWKIRRLGVLPEYAGQNLSQYLIEACINRARLSGITEMRLFMSPWLEPMTRFYEAYGFELAPEIEFTLRNPLEPPPIMMRKTLDY